MYGDLREQSVADVLRTLADRAFTGTLSITAPGGGAQARLVDGDLVRATSPAPSPRIGDRLLNGGLLAERDLAEALTVQEAREDDERLGALLVELGMVSEEAVRLVLHEQVLDALFALLRLERGAFDATEGKPDDHRVRVRLPVDQALAELARRETEWNRIERSVPDLDLVPEFVPGSSASPGLEPDEFTMLARLDGRLSVRQLADATGYGTFDAARVVHGLVLLGVVRLRSPEQAATTPTPGFRAVVGDAPPTSRIAEPVLADDAAAPAEEHAWSSPGGVDEPEPLDFSTDEDVGGDPSDVEDTTPKPATTDDEPDRGERSELLRELSALSFEDDDDQGRRRRGFFGR